MSRTPEQIATDHLRPHLDPTDSFDARLPNRPDWQQQIATLADLIRRERGVAFETGVSFVMQLPRASSEEAARAQVHQFAAARRLAVEGDTAETEESDG